MDVLLIEDDKFMAQMITALLEKMDFRVATVHTTSDALDSLQATPFDAVLLDLRLNEESGMDVLVAARKMGVAYPILILSGDSESGTKADALEAGADDYVTKPFKISELSARVRRQSVWHKRLVSEHFVGGGDVIDLSARNCGRQVGVLLGLPGDIHLDAQEYQHVNIVFKNEGGGAPSSIVA